MPLALAAPALGADDESSEEDAPAAPSLLAALLAPQRPAAALAPTARLLRRLCARPRTHLTPTAARFCDRYDALAAEAPSDEPQPGASGEQLACTADGACPAEPDEPTPCSLLATLLQAGGKGEGAGEEGACPLCALLHAAAHGGDAHAAHECPLCSALAPPPAPSEPEPARVPRALLLWLNPRTRRDWSVLHEEVPGE